MMKVNFIPIYTFHPQRCVIVIHAFVYILSIAMVAITQCRCPCACSVPQGTGLVAVRNLDCTGAATLAACHFNILTAAACTHSQDAALECSE